MTDDETKREFFKKRVLFLTSKKVKDTLTKKQLSYLWDIAYNENPSVSDSIKQATRRLYD